MKNTKAGMGSHQSHVMITDEWLTPPEIVKALGPFDLDPCSPINRPWDTAKTHYTRPIALFEPGGLEKPWFGRVWLNPPYGKHTGKWLKKLSEHGNGIALIFARTETRMFFDYIWYKATAALFIEGRVQFYKKDGTLPEGGNNSGAPSVLIAYGKQNAEILKDSNTKGKFLYL